MINLYDSKCIDFANNGLVILSDCISCSIPEELNGLYECTLEYPLDNKGKWKYLLEGNIIKASGQLFRIYHKIKTLSSIRVNARHIFYDLLDNFLEDVRPTNLSGHGALAYVLANTQYTHPFTSVGDVAGVDTKYFVRKNPVEAIMGQDGIINTWGGELVRDNFNISLLGTRGLDRGVLVSYGKNIQGIEETLDMDGLATRIMVLGKDALMLPEKYIDSPYIDNFSNPKIKVVEFSDIGVDVENGITEAIVLLRAAGQNFMDTSKCDIPQFNYKIDFIELSKTEEYKNYAVLERVYLADTVTIKHSKLNINLKAKVIKITKNVLTNRIEKIELGSFKPNIATAINNSIQEVKKDIVQVRSDYQKAIDNATDLITGSKGGNVVIRQNEEGKPYEILIMDTTDVMTAENVWRWNLGGFGHSSTGINGPYGTAITQDGSIVATFITAGTLSGDRIEGGTIEGTTISGGTITGGSIIGNTITGSTITGTTVNGGSINGTTITGGSITGASIKTSNTTNYMLLHDQYMDFYNNNVKLGSVGYAYDPNFNGYDTGLINANCSFTTYGTGYGFDLRSTGWNYFWGNCDFRGQLKMGSETVATEEWVTTTLANITFQAKFG